MALRTDLAGLPAELGPLYDAIQLIDPPWGKVAEEVLRLMIFWIAAGKDPAAEAQKIYADATAAAQAIVDGGK